MIDIEIEKRTRVIKRKIKEKEKGRQKKSVAPLFLYGRGVGDIYFFEIGLSHIISVTSSALPK